MTAFGYIDERSVTTAAEHDFIAAFLEVFAGPPYYEQYSRSDAKRIWSRHAKRGIISLAYHEEELAGFGCALPLSDPYVSEIRKLLCAHDCAVDPRRTWYMSELGVVPAYRGLGVGSMLIRKRLERIRSLGGNRYCLMTALVGSQSEPLYRKIGAEEIGTDETTSSRFFSGSCEEAIAKLIV